MNEKKKRKKSQLIIKMKKWMKKKRKTIETLINIRNDKRQMKESKLTSFFTKEEMKVNG